MRATVTSAGTLSLASQIYRAALGHGGIRRDRREGDGATPVGILPLRRVFYRADRIAAPKSVAPVTSLSPSDGWCDAPDDPAYNQLVRLPIEASAEALWREDALYDIIGVLGWNDQPVRPGAGSAIFLHVARPDFAPTEGCIALAPDALRTVLGVGLTEILVTE